MINKIGSSSTGLGDILLLTAICKYFPKKITVQLQNKIKRFSILFENLANVEITDNPVIIPDIGEGHYVTRKLRNFIENADYLDNRPLVLYSDIESEIWANDILKMYENPVIFVPNCSKHWHYKRSMPKNIVYNILEQLKNKDYTPIIVQSSENPVDYINDIIKLTDISLSKYICLLRKCGFYCGSNTGDMHLAISVGCMVKVFQPLDDIHFQFSSWCYKHPTIKHFNF